jgi:hypothetical protein
MNQTTNKPRITSGIIIMVIGLALIVGSSVDAIIDSSSKLYKQVSSYEVDLEKKKESIPYFQAEKKKTSFWLALPKRDIEGKKFKITVTVHDENNQLIEGFLRDFTFKTTRQEIEGNYYYKLGYFTFGYDFKGFINYEVEGDWLPESNPILSLKINRKTAFSPNQIIASLSGAIILAIGFITLMRNTSEQGEANA